jgi:bifunctional N-acetylglucosamine-1-phosphate-uridyltransferase/glucosamine-1-phosphate-acetyltransferase GlmU-like protein
MLDRLLQRYSGLIERVVLVVHPSFKKDIEQHIAQWNLPTACVVQPEPTGMLDAIMLAAPAVRQSALEEVWITWCDQVAVHPATVRRLAETMARHTEAALVMPTVRRAVPYVHLQRDDHGRIVRVLHRREGDPMPAEGESDMGVFALRTHAYAELLPLYSREVEIGRATGERNFLPFIPWIAARAEVVTFPAVDEMEATGVNTLEDLASVERYLRSREPELT